MPLDIRLPGRARILARMRIDQFSVSRREFLRQSAVGVAASAGYLGKRDSASPNIVIIFADDLGYADLGCFGSGLANTPALDRMAREGIRFTDFHVAQPVCGASRAALLTGCYPNRIGMLGAPGPKSTTGIADSEMTLGELLKQKNYATAIFGKWHLGHHPQFLPQRHGFDRYLGLPYSNDMWPFHPQDKTYPPLPLIEGERTAEYNPDQSQLTRRYTEGALDFIRQNRNRPFFLYMAHSMPHVPLFVSRKFQGRSGAGVYADVVMEIDWSVAEILRTIQRLGLDENTLVIFTSDNGPWLSYGDHAGSAGPFREGKGTTWEGGHRVPCVMRWPRRIPAGATCEEPVMTIDIFPTIASLTGARLPSHKIDGLDIWPLMSGQPGGRSPHEALYFFWGLGLEAVRSGNWKLHLPHSYTTLEGRPGGKGGTPARYGRGQTDRALFDLAVDPGETRNLAHEKPDMVRRLEGLAERILADLGDEKLPGPGRRPVGRLAESVA